MTARSKRAVQTAVRMASALFARNRQDLTRVLVSYRTFSQRWAFRPKRPAEPRKTPKAPRTKVFAPKRLRALIAAPLIGAKVNHALFFTNFAANTRATLKDDWPPHVEPGVEVDTYEVDTARQHIGTIPFRIDATALTIRGECRAKQGPEQNAATQVWLVVEFGA